MHLDWGFGPHLYARSRLLASKQEEHQGSKVQFAEAAHLGALHLQRHTAASMLQAHAAQPGPGEHRPEGPRSVSLFLFSSLGRWQTLADC